MSTEPTPPKPNRTPWIIAGVLGCLVICLLAVVIGGGAYAFLGRQVGAVTPVVLATLPSPLIPTEASPVSAPTTIPSAPPAETSPAAGGPIAPGLPTAAVPTESTPVTTTESTTGPNSEPSTGTTTEPTLAPVPASKSPTPKPTAKPAATSGKIAYSVNQGDRPEDKYVWIMNADGSNPTKILDRASEPSFSPDGKMIAYYHWTDGIFVVNADGSGAPGKKIVGDSNVGFIDWSHDGRLIAFSALPGGQGNIVVNVVPPDGSALKDSNARRLISVGKSPSWSPDDTQFALDSCDMASHCGIFKVSAGGGPISPIVTDGGGTPAWSPDGNRIVYQTSIDGQTQLFVINVDGTNKKQLTPGPDMHVAAAWSPDGSTIYYRTPQGGSWGIWRMNADGSNPTRLADTPAPVNPAFERLAVTK